MPDMHTADRSDTPRPTAAIGPIAELSHEERAAIEALRDAVYPPEAEGDWSGAALEWATAEWRVGIHAPDGTLACHVGMLVRAGGYDGHRVRIGGVGSVKTHPRYRRRGYAATAMRHAAEFFRARGDISFGLLACDEPLMDYYRGLGWHRFDGRLVVTQYGTEVDFTFSPVMTLPVLGDAPTDGIIDLGGPPW